MERNQQRNHANGLAFGFSKEQLAQWRKSVIEDIEAIESEAGRKWIRAEDEAKFRSLLSTYPEWKNQLRKNGRKPDQRKREEIAKALLELKSTKSVQYRVAERLGMGDEKPSRKMISEVKKKMQAEGRI